MPELPEVETIKQGLNKLIVGKEILDVQTDSPKQVQPSLEAIKKAVVGAKIQNIDRRAKILQIHLSNGCFLIFHLKLTGRLLVRSQGDPRDEWQHVVFTLSDKTELRFCDSRKFGWVKLVRDVGELGEILGKFGPEPFVGEASSEPTLTLEKFKKILSSSSRPVKIILMDQSRIAGVGNIYASDALFLARIDPRRKANSLSLREQSKLFEAVEHVLKLGLKYRGASDQYYLDATGHKGAYQEHFLVYGQQGRDCPENCGGKIKRIVVGGRGTFFCPACQR